MTRTVRRTNAAPEKRADASPRPYSDFTGYPNMVLLGDPGAGKTHLFMEAAVDEAGRFVKARAFLNTPASMLQGQPLFIDGLDEKRAGRADRDTVDALVTKLFAVDPPKVRISCRVADWLGESDLAALSPFFEQRGEVCVLYLESLSRPEQIAVLAGEHVGAQEAEAFIAEANDRGLGEFLENPLNLIMLWRAVQTGSWPITRKELFELSTKLMLQESSKEHARVGSGVYTVEELRPAAGAICATRLISDVEAQQQQQSCISMRCNLQPTHSFFERSNMSERHIKRVIKRAKLYALVVAKESSDRGKWKHNCYSWPEVKLAPATGPGDIFVIDQGTFLSFAGGQKCPLNQKEPHRRTTSSAGAGRLPGRRGGRTGRSGGRAPRTPRESGYQRNEGDPYPHC